MKVNVVIPAQELGGRVNVVIPAQGPGAGQGVRVNVSNASTVREGQGVRVNVVNAAQDRPWAYSRVIIPVSLLADSSASVCLMSIMCRRHAPGP